MTNNPTIDGVSLEDERHAAVKTLHDIMQSVPSASLYSLAEAVIDAGYAPAVERQEICSKHSGDSCKSCGGSGLVNDGELTCSSGGEPYENGPIECVKDCPECQGAHQSTIARLEARVAELESGRGEPFFYGIMRPDGKPHYSELCVSGEASDLESEAESWTEDGDGVYRVVPLFTAPPVPVAVVLPECKPRVTTAEEPDSHIRMLEQIERNGWNACLDATAALNGDKP